MPAARSAKSTPGWWTCPISLVAKTRLACVRLSMRTSPSSSSGVGVLPSTRVWPPSTMAKPSLRM